MGPDDDRRQCGYTGLLRSFFRRPNAIFGRGPMTSGPSVQIPRKWTPHLRWAFLLIIAGFILAGVSSIYVMRKTLTEIESIEDRALGSIELVFRLSHYIDVRRRLFEAHIVATRSTDMREIEERLARFTCPLPSGKPPRSLSMLNSSIPNSDPRERRTPTCLLG